MKIARTMFIDQEVFKEFKKLCIDQGTSMSSEVEKHMKEKVGMKDDNTR